MRIYRRGRKRVRSLRRLRAMRRRLRRGQLARYRFRRSRYLPRRYRKKNYREQRRHVIGIAGWGRHRTHCLRFFRARRLVRTYRRFRVSLPRIRRRYFRTVFRKLRRIRRFITRRLRGRRRYILGFPFMFSRGKARRAVTSASNVRFLTAPFNVYNFRRKKPITFQPRKLPRIIVLHRPRPLWVSRVLKQLILRIRALSGKSLAREITTAWFTSDTYPQKINVACTRFSSELQSSLATLSLHSSLRSRLTARCNKLQIRPRRRIQVGLELAGRHYAAKKRRSQHELACYSRHL